MFSRKIQKPPRKEANLILVWLIFSLPGLFLRLWDYCLGVWKAFSYITNIRIYQLQRKAVPNVLGINWSTYLCFNRPSHLMWYDLVQTSLKNKTQDVPKVSFQECWQASFPPTASFLVMFQMRRLNCVINMLELYLQVEKNLLFLKDCLAEHYTEKNKKENNTSFHEKCESKELTGCGCMQSWQLSFGITATKFPFIHHWYWATPHSFELLHVTWYKTLL